MDPTQNTVEDPLVAALPPATDYITYLTLLEYQLKPHNLSTLNRLLTEDDGSLASEIGWDLLKLVLPMLQVAFEDANECLAIIARRGNPREVVVRVAEELERLGHHGDDHGDVEDDAEQDPLPTFAGEAPRIHLGEMKLDGMPPPKEEVLDNTSSGPTASDTYASHVGEHGSDDILILQALLSMLSIVHPRINTRYPSRFLATSLPAALGAYRRMNITAETTTAFIAFLSKMAGKQRPALPPRISTTGSTASLTIQPSVTTSGGQSAPLPDPEAKTDPSSSDAESAANEKAITNRLLQAVMLELLDDYTTSFQSTDFPTMGWTVRLREKHEPRRVLPGRPTETQRWTQSAELHARDEIAGKILKLSKDLNLGIAKTISDLVSPEAVGPSAEVEQPDFDYPSSPSQIPFPPSGLTLLFAARDFAQDTTGITTAPSLSLVTVKNLFMSTFTPRDGLVTPISLAQTDALLSLTYATLQSPLPPPTPTSTSTTTSQTDTSAIDLPFLTNLTNLFITSPDPFIRDSTHHLTTLLLHHHTSPSIKLLYIKSLLSPHQSPSSPIHDIQQGNIRSLALTWLKDEFLAYHAAASAVAAEQSPALLHHTPAQTSFTASTLTQSGLNPSLMTTDPDLIALIFPSVPSAPSPFITSHTSQPESESDLESLLLQVPAYVSSLNLLCILATLPLASLDSSGSSEQQRGSTATTSVALQGTVLEHATQFLSAISAWKDLLVGFARGIAQNEAKNGGKGPIDTADVYALEDAVERARGAVDSLSE